ncbi:hypothetical protein ARMSODRAFT_983176 [Armillaria solidipes]|uniref:Uncharacterized protein n=1 Tax=Armillaria solidipes TaxID=1076256 RepID=A0A2H3AWR7_9AGAR|nr:hypothetical protein ARMSODRAFT_983176 [Armillaria solidipes]
MSFASPPHDGSRWLSLKYPRYKTLRRRYHPYTRPGSVLLIAFACLDSRRVYQTSVGDGRWSRWSLENGIGCASGPVERLKLCFFQALAICIRVVESVCRCDVI